MPAKMNYEKDLNKKLELADIEGIFLDVQRVLAKSLLPEEVKIASLLGILATECRKFGMSHGKFKQVLQSSKERFKSVWHKIKIDSHDQKKK